MKFSEWLNEALRIRQDFNRLRHAQIEFEYGDAWYSDRIEYGRKDLIFITDPLNRKGIIVTKECETIHISLDNHISDMSNYFWNIDTILKGYPHFQNHINSMDRSVFKRISEMTN